MWTANYTEGDENKSFVELWCSAHITTEMCHQLNCISVLISFLSITAILGNTLILVALSSESSLHPPTKLFLRCLAVTDLCVGFISQPLAVIYSISVVSQSLDICLFSRKLKFITSYLFCSVSLLTLSAISVDRLLALMLRLRYRQVVTLKKTHAILIIIWIVSIVTATMSLWSNTITLWYGRIGITLCLVTSSFCYTTIFVRLRSHERQIQDHVHQVQPAQIPLNITRYKKAVYSALWLQLTLVACYLPYGIAEALYTQNRASSSLFLADKWTEVIVYLNSSLNPFLYCWKIREVKQAVKDIMQKFPCSAG
ncbi:melanocyte-stimulating hormone receptor-like [Oculina patagonica]